MPILRLRKVDESGDVVLVNGSFGWKAAVLGDNSREQIDAEDHEVDCALKDRRSARPE